jgi:undecaprenyl-diphosphatase
MDTVGVTAEQRAGARPEEREGERRLGTRLLLAVVAAFVLVVPFGLIMLAVELRWRALEELDTGAARALTQVTLSHGWLKSFLETVATVLHPTVFRVVIVGVGIVLFWRGARRLAIWAVVTIVAASLLDLGMKAIVARARPVLDDPVTSAPGYSFPSGHAMDDLVGVAVLALLLHPVLKRRWQRVVLWTVAALVVLLVGYDRVGLGVHFVSDVVGGWVFGIAVLLATIAGFETWRRKEGRPARGPVEGLHEEAEREFDQA